MLIIEVGVKCNQSVIRNNLASWNVDISSIPVTVKAGSWSLDAFGNYTKTGDSVRITAYDSKWFHIIGGKNASAWAKLMARVFGRYSKDTAVADLAISKIIYHEWCHIHGIDECRNPDKTKRHGCIMYENLWYQEIAAMPLQMLNKLALCDDCKKRLKK